MKTLVRIDVFKDKTAAEQEMKKQSAMPGHAARLTQFGAATWSWRPTGSETDVVAFNAPFEQGVWVVMTEVE